MRHLSGIRPTGHIHIGNYLSTIRGFSEKYPHGIMFVADLHGLHTADDVQITLDTLQRFGVKTGLQSAFGYDHLLLYTNLQHLCTIGELNRMTQYKEKSEKEKQTAALLTYPVLMAADILFNRATHVIVGEDQLQHIELARTLQQRLGDDSYPKPQAIVGQYKRIMSLTDATKKMSKSNANDMSRINLNDSPDVIRKKIRLAKTSTSIDDNSPEVANLMMIYTAFGGVGRPASFKHLKDELAELIISEICNT